MTPPGAPPDAAAREGRPSRRAAAAAALAVFVQAAAFDAAVAQPAPAPLQTVERLDLPRYMGTWYEIAKFPNRFQAQCASDTVAVYTAQADGTVRVVNRCRTEKGETTEATGLARPVGGPDSPRLQVRFAPAWLSWWPAVWGDYWVVDLEPDYQLVAVSEPRRQYLWILARTPRVDPARLAALVKRLAGQGLEVSRLQSAVDDPGTRRIRLLDGYHPPPPVTGRTDGTLGHRPEPAGDVSSPDRRAARLESGG